MSGKNYTYASVGDGITGGPGTPLPPPHSPLVLRSKANEPDGGPGSRCPLLPESLLEIYPKPAKLSPESLTEMIRARNEKGMSQDKLNTACSFPQGTIKKIENGMYCPTLEQINDIKQVLDVVVKYA